MKKVIILIPVYNDWESLNKLLEEINSNIKNISNIKFDCLVVNDASTIERPKIIKPENIRSLKIFNMKLNKGHARCNAFGIRYINSYENFDYLLLMDGDGEDRPVEIKTLIEKATNNQNNSVVAKRIKRSEGFLFQLLYKIHKLITLIFTGKNINFGNYSCLTKKDVAILTSDANLWSSFSGTLKKRIRNLDEIDSIRGMRYFGPSQMSLFKLIVHSFSIIAVFKYQVLTRSLIMILILEFLNPHLGLITNIFQILILVFCAKIFVIASRANKQQFINSEKNLKNVNEITR